MSIERLMPGSLEGYDDLESLGDAYRQGVEEALDEHIADGNPLIDEVLEIEYPELLHYTELLARVIYNDGLAIDVDSDMDYSATAYRAFHFGLLLSLQLQPPESWGFNFAEIDDYDDHLDLQQQIIDKTNRYLQHRPVLDGFIDRYLPLVSPQPHCQAGAKTIAALALMQVENHLVSNFAEFQTAGAEQELDNWHDAFPDDGSTPPTKPEE
jgi:hypothetical protein